MMITNQWNSNVMLWKNYIEKLAKKLLSTQSLHSINKETLNDKDHSQQDRNDKPRFSRNTLMHNGDVQEEDLEDIIKDMIYGLIPYISTNYSEKQWEKTLKVCEASLLLSYEKLKFTETHLTDVLDIIMFIHKLLGLIEIIPESVWPVISLHELNSTEVYLISLILDMLFTCLWNGLHSGAAHVFLTLMNVKQNGSSNIQQEPLFSTVHLKPRLIIEKLMEMEPLKMKIVLQYVHFESWKNRVDFALLSIFDPSSHYHEVPHHDSDVHQYKKMKLGQHNDDSNVLEFFIFSDNFERLEIVSALMDVYCNENTELSQLFDRQFILSYILSLSLKSISYLEACVVYFKKWNNKIIPVIEQDTLDKFSKYPSHPEANSHSELIITRSSINQIFTYIMTRNQSSLHTIQLKLTMVEFAFMSFNYAHSISTKKFLVNFLILSSAFLESELSKAIGTFPTSAEQFLDNNIPILDKRPRVEHKKIDIEQFPSILLFSKGSSTSIHNPSLIFLIQRVLLHLLFYIDLEQKGMLFGNLLIYTRIPSQSKPLLTYLFLSHSLSIRKTMKHMKKPLETFELQNLCSNVKILLDALQENITMYDFPLLLRFTIDNIIKSQSSHLLEYLDAFIQPNNTFLMDALSYSYFICLVDKVLQMLFIDTHGHSDMVTVLVRILRKMAILARGELQEIFIKLIFKYGNFHEKTNFKVLESNSRDTLIINPSLLLDNILSTSEGIQEFIFEVTRNFFPPPIDYVHERMPYSFNHVGMKTLSTTFQRNPLLWDGLVFLSRESNEFLKMKEIFLCLLAENIFFWQNHPSAKMKNFHNEYQKLALKKISSIFIFAKIQLFSSQATLKNDQTQPHDKRNDIHSLNTNLHSILHHLIDHLDTQDLFEFSFSLWPFAFEHFKSKIPCPITNNQPDDGKSIDQNEGNTLNLHRQRFKILLDTLIIKSFSS